ncbi:homeobox protein goosecoid-like [Culicoides brevitarsis]|uniref:homeobox protein goosecoid-like n=1 Tax=Culicoides brevitarsis TaxID=469753 RepID=UPI00307C03E7
MKDISHGKESFKLQNPSAAQSPATLPVTSVDYSEDDSCPSSPSESAMVETNHATSHHLNRSPSSPPRAMSAETQNYLNTTAMLGNYLGHRLSSLQNERNAREIPSSPCSPPSPSTAPPAQSPNGTRTQAPTSLFTIDSILAPTKSNVTLNNNNRSSESPGSSPPASANTSPMRPRIPMLHHPGLHLGHLAAAAASGFGSTSEFLVEERS